MQRMGANFTKAPYVPRFRAPRKLDQTAQCVSSDCRFGCFQSSSGEAWGIHLKSLLVRPRDFAKDETALGQAWASFGVVNSQHSWNANLFHHREALWNSSQCLRSDRVQSEEKPVSNIR